MELNPAPLKLRFFALLIDFVLILLYVSLLLILTLCLYYFTLGSIPSLNIYLAQAAGFLTLTLPVALYFIWCELSQSQASFGKQVCGLKVASVNSGSLTLKHVVVRNIVKFLPWEYAHTLVYILMLVPGTLSSTGLLFGLIVANIIPLLFVCFVIFQTDHRGPHDLISNTIVLKT